MRRTAAAKRREALALLVGGHSTREVVTIVGISQGAVSSIAQANREIIPYNVGGRPRKLSLGAAKYAKLMVQRGQVKSAAAAAEILNQMLPEPVSVRTVSRGLKAVGMEVENGMKRPAQKKKHAKKRKHTKKRKLVAMK